MGHITCQDCGNIMMGPGDTYTGTTLPKFCVCKASRENKDHKLDHSHLFEGTPKARDQVTKRYEFGANKHGRGNHLKSLGTDKHDEWVAHCRASMSRHYESFKQGEIFDEDGLTHLSGVIWNAIDLIEYNT